MNYRVEVVPSTKKALKNIESQYVKKILRIDLLQIDPRLKEASKCLAKKIPTDLE